MISTTPYDVVIGGITNGIYFSLLEDRLSDKGRQINSEALFGREVETFMRESPNFTELASDVIRVTSDLTKYQAGGIEKEIQGIGVEGYEFSMPTYTLHIMGGRKFTKAEEFILNYIVDSQNADSEGWVMTLETLQMALQM